MTQLEPPSPPPEAAGAEPDTGFLARLAARAFEGAVTAASPNVNARRDGAAPDMVIVHYTAMASAEAAVARLVDPGSEVSAHYVVGEDGRLWILAPDAARAWHAGVSFWAGVSDVNSRAIGVELANPADEAGPMTPFPEPQMNRLEALLAKLTVQWSIPRARVLGHSDVAPGRKSDPGPKFDWARLGRRGLALGPEATCDVSASARPAPLPDRSLGSAARFAAAARRIGYGDWRESDLLDAFRLRFRPAARGRSLEETDARAAEVVAARWPSQAAA